MAAYYGTPGDPRLDLVEGAELAQLVEAANKPSASGATGTLAKTNANDTVSAAGTTTIVGTSARTNANDSVSAAGTTTVVGTLAKTNANDTVSASGTTTVTGTVATTNANDTVDASGTVSSSTVTGTSSTSNANDTAAASGTTTLVGTSATSNNADSVTASGNAGTPAPQPDDGGSHSLGGRPKARKFPTPRRVIDLPTISGTARLVNLPDLVAAAGEVDPYGLLADEQELLLLV